MCANKEIQSKLDCYENLGNFLKFLKGYVKESLKEVCTLTIIVRLGVMQPMNQNICTT